MHPYLPKQCILIYRMCALLFTEIGYPYLPKTVYPYLPISVHCYLPITLTQVVTLLSYHTAFENALLACELRNSLFPQKVQHAIKLFKEFNLDVIAFDRFPNELSGGMKQRIGLIQTLLVDADLYLFDEPFNAIDRKTTLTIQEYIWNKFKNEKLSAIIVAHDLDQSIQTSDRVLIMKNHKSILEEINFDQEFTLLAPTERLKSKYYNQYIIQIINSLNEA